MVITMSHEMTHTTDRAGINNLRNRDPNSAPEAAPTEFHHEVHREIENNRGRRP
jgi:hypothetical protein